MTNSQRDHDTTTRLDQYLYQAPSTSHYPCPELDPYLSTIGYVVVDEFSALYQWLMTDQSLFSVHICVGQSGLGKTRLARELIRVAKDQGFVAGFADFSPALLAALGSLADKPLLVVLDNQELSHWLSVDRQSFYAINQGGQQPVKLLIFERCQEHPFSHIHHWLNQHVIDTDHVSIAPLLSLKGLVTLEQRRALLHQLLNHLTYQSTYYLDAKALLRSGHLDMRLMQTDWAASPLSLTVSGLLTEHHGMQSLLSLDRIDVLFESAEFYLNQLKKRNKGALITSDWLMHVLAYIHLVDDVTPTQLAAFIDQEQSELAENWRIDTGDVIELLSDWLMHDHHLTNLKPRLINDAITYYVLEKGPLPNNLSQSLLLRTYRLYPHNTLRVLLRIAQDLSSPKVRHFLFSSLDKLWLDFPEVQDQALLHLIISELPISPAQAQAINHQLFVTVLNHILERINRCSIEEGQYLSSALEAFYQRLLSIDANPIALLVLNTLTRLYLQLSKSPLNNQQHYVAQLADALTVMGECLLKQDRFSDALNTWQQAVDIYQDLTTSNAQRYQRKLSYLVERLATLYGQLGHMDEALRYAGWGAQLYVHLATIEPDCLPEVVNALNQLARSLDEIGQADAALTAISQAIATALTLAKENPTKFHPLLLALLSEQNRYLMELAQYDQALEVIKKRAVLLGQGVTISFALEVSALRAMLIEGKQYAYALEAAKLALNIYLEVNRAQSAPAMAELAMELKEMAQILNVLEQPQAALTTLNEALTVVDALYDQDPVQHLALWLGLHHVLAKQCYDLHHADAALKIAEKALPAVVDFLQQKGDLQPHLLASLVEGYLTYSEKTKTFPKLHLIRPILHYFSR